MTGYLNPKTIKENKNLGFNSKTDKRKKFFR